MANVILYASRFWHSLDGIVHIEAGEHTL
ncbi:hypothetical protein EYZ11_011827 [Aspergillus tanneri]|uniref:Uncharacterized protein n=1 Tax=Aspergillus tanneri TaxID=1220188 RepID=A0A4S3J3X6_9EURO|nr:hypothetical protein EYZ11_011827 [Aspergillus tanneri]